MGFFTRFGRAVGWAITPLVLVQGCSGSEAPNGPNVGPESDATAPNQDSGPGSDSIAPNPDSGPGSDAIAPNQDSGPGDGSVKPPPILDAGNGGPACAASPQIDGNLSPLWSTTLGVGYNAAIATDSANDIVVAGSAQGSIAIGGQTYTLPNAGGIAAPFIFELDPSGQVLWHREFSGAGNILAMALDPSGNIYIAGSFDVAGSSSPTLDLGTGVLQGSFFLAKLSPTGSTLWTYTAQPYRSGSGSEIANLSIAVDPSGHVAVVGDALVPAAIAAGSADGASGPTSDAAAVIGGDQGFIAVFDSSGNPSYNKVFGVDGPGSHPQFDSAGNLFVAGQFQQTLDLSSPLTAPSGSTAFAAMLDPTGQVVWQVADGTFSSAMAVTTNAAGAVMAGTFSGTIGLSNPTSAQGPDDVFLVGLDETGAQTFQKTFPASGLTFDALATDPAGGIVAAGRLSAYANLGGGLLAPPGVAIAKFDDTGNPVYSARLAVDVYSGLEPTAPALAVDTGGNVVLAGAFYGAADLGTGVLPSADPSSSLNPTLYVARYAPAAPQLPAPRADCPVPPTDAGLPDGGRLIALGAWPGFPSDTALTPSTVYWTTGSEVMRAPFDGGSAAAPVAIAQRGAHAIVFRSDSLYWTNQGSPAGTGSVVSLPLDGGAIVTLASGQDAPGALAVDDSNVYVVAGGSSLDDGGVSTVTLLSIPVTGGMPATLVSGLGSAGPVAVNNGVVAFVSRSTGNDGGALSQISTVPTDGGAPTVLATSDRGVPSIALDGTNVYWVDSSTHGVDTISIDGRIRSVPLVGGPATILADNQANPAKMVLLGSNLYWAAAGTAAGIGLVNNGGLYSLPVTGGTPVGLVTNRTGIGPFDLTATQLAWFDLLNPETELFGLFVMNR